MIKTSKKSNYKFTILEEEWARAHSYYISVLQTLKNIDIMMESPEGAKYNSLVRKHMSTQNDYKPATSPNK